METQPKDLQPADGAQHKDHPSGQNPEVEPVLAAQAGPFSGPGTKDKTWQFRLYVAGGAPHSQLALANLQSLGERYLAGNYTVEIVDVLKVPERTLEDGVYVTPTLIRLFPEPVSRIIGNLSDQKLVLMALGIEERLNG